MGSSKSRLRVNKILRDKVVVIPLLILTLWTLLPLLWGVSASFKPPLEVFKTPPSIIPKDFTVSAYGRALAWPGFFRYLGNSFLLAVSSTCITVVVSLFASYAFARYAFWMRSVFLMMILIPRILPRASLIVPLYEIFASLGLINTYAVLILTYTATAIPISTWILTGFFRKVPKDLEESAEIDGARLWQILLKIVMPLSLPGLLMVTVVSFIQSWQEFPFVLALTTDSSKRTLTYQLYMLRDTLGVPDWPLLNAFTLLTIVPVIILYLIFENNIVSGLMSGALKD